MEVNRIYHGDCLDLMHGIEPKSIDMILCDLPYGTTACKWDTIIPFEPLWAQYKRIIKDNGAIVLTASQPFTSMLVMSNREMFKYEWIWEKSLACNFCNANNTPLKRHENICVFSLGTCANKSNKRMNYNPQGVKIANKIHSRPRLYDSEHNLRRPSHSRVRIIKREGFPISVLKFSHGNNKNIHPTQKPVALFEYLIKTYTNPGDLILDNCAGSGTTGIAAMNTGRRFILMEKDEGYFKIARERIEKAQQKELCLFGETP